MNDDSTKCEAQREPEIRSFLQRINGALDNLEGAQDTLRQRIDGACRNEPHPEVAGDPARMAHTVVGEQLQDILSRVNTMIDNTTATLDVLEL